MRALAPLLCLAPGLALAAEDPAVAETARRLRMPQEIVEQHHRSGCDSGRPGEELICGTYDLVMEERELERVLGVLASQIEDKDARDKLAAAQAAWQDFREKACQFESDGYARGRDLGAVLASCKADYTRARSAQLKAAVDCGGRLGCPGQ